MAADRQPLPGMAQLLPGRVGSWGLSHFHFLWLPSRGRQALRVVGPAAVVSLMRLTAAAAAAASAGTVSVPVEFCLIWLTCLLLDRKARPYFQPSQRILEAHLSNSLVALLQGALAADCASLNLTSY